MKKYIALILITLICGCNSSWMEKKEGKEDKIQGVRIPAFALDNSLSLNNSTSHVDVAIPPRYMNVNWPSSASGQVEVPDNLALAANLANYMEYSVAYIKRQNWLNLTATPVVLGDMVFAMNRMGEIFAYDKKNLQTPVWSKFVDPSTKFKKYAGGGAAYADGKLYVTGGHRDIVALDPVSGKELWRRMVNNVVRAAPVVSGDRMFVITIDNRLYCISTNDGTVFWVHEGATENVGIFGSASMAISGDKLIVPHSSGQLHALNVIDGSEVWAVNLAYNRANIAGFSLADIDITPIIRNNHVYVAGNAGYLYSINLDTGDLEWQKDIKSIRSLWTSGNVLFATDVSNQLICINVNDGGVKWIKQLPQYAKPEKKSSKLTIAGPVIANDKLFVTASNGKLFVISPISGEIEKEISVARNITLPPIVAGGVMYLLSNDGKLAVLN